MEQQDREFLIRVEQQLKDSVANQSQMFSDLKEIFGRIETDSKCITQIKGDLQTLIQTEKLKNKEFERRLDECQNETESISSKLDSNSDKINQEREDRISAINTESTIRSNFESSTNASIKTLKWVFGILGSIATVLSAIVLIMQFIGR